MPQFDHPSQFTPLLPNKEFGELREKSEALAKKALNLKNNTNQATSAAIRSLVRIVSSYYSNLIEDEAVHPLSISQAMLGDFSEDTSISQRQRKALAHIKAGQVLEQLSGETDPTYTALHTSNLVAAHRALYSLLEPPDKTTLDGRIVQPGALRQVEVLVGHHWPPAASSVPAFLRHMDEVYPTGRGLESLLLSAAAAHHRACWVHPFGDGNGRACRLYSDNALRPISGGLWTISRGLSRHKEAYFNLLATADSPRQGDLDGRGNLSLKGLTQWCKFYLDVIEEEVDFLCKNLTTPTLNERVLAVVRNSSMDTPIQKFADSAWIAFMKTLTMGPLRFEQLLYEMNLSRPDDAMVLQWLQDVGFLVRCEPTGYFGANFPIDKVDQMLPGLFPEATPQTDSNQDDTLEAS